MLEGLIGPGLGHARQHRVHRFARAVAEQPLHVPAQRQPLRRCPKHSLNASSHLIRRRNWATVQRVSTAAQRTEFSEKVQCPQNRITRAFSPNRAI